MPLPFFYEENLNDATLFTLSEETSKHIIQVLRMRTGEQLQLTNGKGKVLISEIISENKKGAEVKVVSTSNIEHRTSGITIAISLVKNNSRFEWFLEKAAEIGVSAIIPLICERTEKHNFRHDRMKNILVSAILQSQQSWLPVLHQPTKFLDVIKHSSQPKKYIAHCIEEKKIQLSNETCLPARQANEQSAIILIGPEGDFTKAETEEALKYNFVPVSLGNNRLRTETAGLVACVILKFS